MKSENLKMQEKKFVSETLDKKNLIIPKFRVIPKYSNKVLWLLDKISVFTTHTYTEIAYKHTFIHTCTNIQTHTHTHTYKHTLNLSTGGSS